MRLDSQVVLITGAAGGIGPGCAPYGFFPAADPAASPAGAAQPVDGDMTADQDPGPCRKGPG